MERTKIKGSDNRDPSAPWAAAAPKPGKRLLKVCESPATWIEVDSDLTEEQINNKIKEYQKSSPSLKDMADSGYFKSLDSENPHSFRYAKYSGPIYHIPFNNSTTIK